MTRAETFFLRAVLATTAGSWALTVAPAAVAQTEPLSQSADSGLLEEIVVTAQKRRQTLLEVPQSISVVGGETLERSFAMPTERWREQAIHAATAG